MVYESLLVLAVIVGVVAIGSYFVRKERDATPPPPPYISEGRPERHTDWRTAAGLARSLSLSRKKTGRQRVAALVRWLSLALTALLWLYAIAHWDLYRDMGGMIGGKRVVFLELAIPGGMGLVWAEAIEYWNTSTRHRRSRKGRER